MEGAAAAGRFEWSGDGASPLLALPDVLLRRVVQLVVPRTELAPLRLSCRAARAAVDGVQPAALAVRCAPPPPPAAAGRRCRRSCERPRGRPASTRSAAC